MADIANGIVTEILDIRKDKRKWVSIVVGLVIPLGIYLAVGITALLWNNFCVRVNCFHRARQAFHAPTFKCIRKRPHGLEWVSIIVNACTILGGVCYFFGDNLRKVYTKDNIRIITLVFSVIGVFTYRIIPLVVKILQRYCKDKPKKSKNQKFSWCSPNDSEAHSLIVAYTYLLTIVIDFDVCITLVLKKADSDVLDSLCGTKDEKTILWFLYVCMIISFLITQLIVTIIVCRRQLRNLFKLKLPTCTCISCACCVARELILSIAVLLAVCFFLFADNQHLLDCDKVEKELKPKERYQRVAFLLFSFMVLAVVIIGFFCRTICCGVQVKEEIISVDVLPDDRLKVYFKEKIGSFSHKYKIRTSEISIDSDCSHHQLYENDIERIINCLGDIGKLVAVNVQEDEIAVVCEIKGTLYVVVHHTSKGTKNEVYTENDSIPQNRTSELYDRMQTHIAMYYQGDYLYSIHLQQHEQYVVRVKEPKDAVTFVDFVSFNVKADQDVLRVPENPLSTIKEKGKYDPKKRQFEDVDEHNMNLGAQI